MAVTATLVMVGHNRLRYLISHDGGAGDFVDIAAAGGATPDLLTDSVAGPIKALAKALDDGFAQIAAGTPTQAKARALWLSDWSGADPGNGNTQTAVCRITRRTGTQAWLVDADTDSGEYIIEVTSSATAAGSAYLDIEILGPTGA